MTVTVLEAILLGLVQGLTEFLPVSSSGHLVITQALLGITDDVLIFDVFVHLGTLAAVFAAFWQDILALLKKPFCRFTALIIVGCIPAGLMGVLLNDFFNSLYNSLLVVAIALIVTGILLFISDRFHGEKTIADMSFGDALLVGLFQGCAIVPGLSRSGSTIFGSLLCGLKRAEAARYSFILSIPVILGAALLESIDIFTGETVFEWTYFLGAAVAAACGYFAIRVFLKLLEKRNMRFFSYYVWLVAAAILISRIFA
ncbi:MAG: undecaprenyl-diphosphate phosphatase [Bacillota bacterium]|nr:undecaprenyl-diphosphate phosphatase [Bacillota bacterium]